MLAALGHSLRDGRYLLERKLGQGGFGAAGGFGQLSVSGLPAAPGSKEVPRRYCLWSSHPPFRRPLKAMASLAFARKARQAKKL